MADAAVPPDSAQPAKSKRSKKKKSKNHANKTNGQDPRSNGADGVEHDQGAPNAHTEAEADADNDSDSPLAADEIRIEADSAEADSELRTPKDLVSAKAEGEIIDPTDASNAEVASSKQQASVRPNGLTGDDAETRLEAAAQERDQLRLEVTELRKSLEEIQQRHQTEVAHANDQLAETQTGKENAEGKYQKLLGQVNTIKKQLGERLKADAEDLSQARSLIDDLERQNRTSADSNKSLQSRISELQEVKEQQEEEIISLRSRTSLSQQNWAKERDDLASREALAREEFDAARQAMQDWEVLAMEERSLREGLSDRVAELEDQVSSQEDIYARAVAERDTQSTTVDGLQRALQEIQEARKQELREVVEGSQAQVEELRNSLTTAETLATAAQTDLLAARQELERALPFEREVKEKNLLIGKLRHEAVILNDHLTKALRFLKKGRPEDTVDRQLVTNHFMHFLALDRTDPKKFQVLQLISALLGWTEEQNEAAGLARPGASSQPINPAQSSSLRLPLTPFRRVSSSGMSGTSSPSASMNMNNIFNAPSPGPYDPNGRSPMSGPRGETLAELWSGFLEREAQEGVGRSRRTSTSTVTEATSSMRPNKGREYSEMSISEIGEH